MSYLNHKPFANQYWFPFAALFAAIYLPLSVAGQLAWLSLAAGLSSPLAHGHEMIFGFAMAVVAGYILGPQTRRFTFSLITIWLLARISFIWQPFGLLSFFFNALFFVLLLRKVLPVFLRAIKRWMNGTVGVVVLALASLFIGLHIVILQGDYIGQIAPNFLFEAILFLSALMFFMGGRMIGPAMGVFLQQEKNITIDRIQMRFEKRGLLILAFTLLANLLFADSRPWIVAGFLIAAAAVVIVRLFQWQFWHGLQRADIASLLLGYSWLAIAWLLIAWALITPQYPISFAYHAITVGALGSLTFTVMARGRMHKELKSPNAIPWIFSLVVLINAAAVLRLSLLQLDAQQALFYAAACWSLAFMGLFVMMLTLQIRKLNKA